MQDHASEKPTPVRHFVLASLAIGAILSYLLRVCISTAGTTIKDELGLSEPVLGEIFAAFFFGYFWMQIPGGWIGGKYGARWSLGAMGLLWAAATAVSAASYTADVLYWSRVAQGLAQAGLFPVTIMAIRDWYPSQRHGLASSVITACMSAGAVLASAFTTRLLALVGWRETFYIYAALAAVWGVWMLFWFRDRPSLHGSVNQAELDLIGTPGKSERTPVVEIEELDLVGAEPPTGNLGRSPLLRMLTSPAMWALNAQAFFQAFAYAVFITWFPAYLEIGRGTSKTAAGDLTILPLLAIVVGSVIGGQLIDVILKRTGNRWLSRSALPAAGLAVCAVATAVAAWIPGAQVAVGLIGIGMVFTGIAMPGKWACVIDLTGARSATGFAVMNMSGNIGAWICPIVVGRLFKDLAAGKGDWSHFLYLVAAVFLAGAVCCLLVDPNKPAIGPEFDKKLKTRETNV